MTCHAAFLSTMLDKVCIGFEITSHLGSVALKPFARMVVVYITAWMHWDHPLQ